MSQVSQDNDDNGRESLLEKWEYFTSPIQEGVTEPRLTRCQFMRALHKYVNHPDDPWELEPTVRDLGLPKLAEGGEIDFAGWFHPVKSLQQGQENTGFNNLADQKRQNFMLKISDLAQAGSQCKVLFFLKKIIDVNQCEFKVKFYAPEYIIK